MSVYGTNIKASGKMHEHQRYSTYLGIESLLTVTQAVLTLVVVPRC